MSASTSAAGGNFRKLDVDQYDADRVLPSELYQQDPRAPHQILADAQNKDKTVRGFIQRGDNQAALAEALRQGEWPYGEEDGAEVSQAKVRRRFPPNRVP